MNMSSGLDAATFSVSRVAAEFADAVDRTSRFPDESFLALRREGLLSLLVPRELGGQGRRLADVAATCQAIAQSCGSSAMIFAMHHIQVACVVAHGWNDDWHCSLLRRVSACQLLLGSATSEAGTGGNIHASVCGIQLDNDRVRLAKDVPTVSYGAHSDALLITAKRTPDAQPTDQVMLVALRDDYTLERTARWDALGMRGTCSDSFLLRASADPAQILPVPFADIASQTMLPVSHLLWSSVWLGIATDAVGRARGYLRQQARTRRSTQTWGADRLARATSLLQLMQSRLVCALTDYDSVLVGGPRALPLSFTADMNNLKTSISELCVQVVQHALMICGINGYKYGTEFSLGRHIRDLLSAPIMINNDRMLESTGNLLLMHRSVLGGY